MKKLFAIIASIALSVFAAESAETNELLSLAEDELTVIVNGRPVEGAEKTKVLLEQKKLDGAGKAGIGAQIGQMNGTFVIIKPLPDSPAMKAGLLQGDVIAAIDGTPTEGLALAEVVQRIRGETGSTVTLAVSRSGLARPFEVNLIREKIGYDTNANQSNEPAARTSIFIMRKDASLPPEFLEGATNTPPQGTDSSR
jgi:C-terminal processing protease CtpA/Prc